MATSGLPPLSAVQSTSFAHLSEAAAHRRRLATRWERALAEVRDSMRRPGGTDWEGQAAARAHYRSTVDVVTIGRAVDRLHDAAAVAGRGKTSWRPTGGRCWTLSATPAGTGLPSVRITRSPTAPRVAHASSGRRVWAKPRGTPTLSGIGWARCWPPTAISRPGSAPPPKASMSWRSKTCPGSTPRPRMGCRRWISARPRHREPPGGMSSGDIDAIDAANRALLQDMLAEYSRLPDGQVKTDRLADIAAIQEALRVPDSHLIYVARPDDPADMIPAVTAVGDPFTADHVSVTVPGVSGTTRQTIATMTQEARGLREEARVIAHSVGESENVATIAWVGYQPPPVLASWNTVDDDLAQAGAPKLEAFLRDLQAGSHNPGHTTALFGHSYGSLLSGIALKDGASSLVDNAVLYGSPGFDATSPAKLGMNDHNFFVMTTPDDPIRYPARLAPLHGWGSDGADTIGTVGRQGTPARVGIRPQRDHRRIPGPLPLHPSADRRGIHSAG